MADEWIAPGESLPSEATLTFHEQADGRKVARLMGGKVVLLRREDVDKARTGEQWRVSLLHRETFSVATLVERVKSNLANPVLTAALGAALSKAVVPRGDATSAPPPAPAAATAQGRTEAKPAPPPITPSRVVGMNDRVALFVDGANMDLAARLAGYFVDWRKAREFFLSHGLFYAAYYYIADYTASDADGRQQRYLDFLAHSDFIVRRKAVKVVRDQETGERVLKANVDTELILDLVNTADNYDLAFLFSGDSDFERAVDLLRSRGKRVYVVSARAVLSRELAYVADKPIFFLEDFREVLARDDRTGG
ncbi:MAG: hypothetical protein AMXMBFR57_26290 [Acidimicrobiia bacterium]